jgi:hydrogenase maturation protease
MNRTGKILLLGYGNTLRGDDGVGPRVAGTVAGWGLPEVEAIERHQLTPELAEPISRASRVIFVDAAVNQDGDMVKVTPLVPEAAQQVMYHTASPAALLGLAEAIFGRAPAAWLVSIPVNALDIGECLSPQAERGVAVALEKIRELLSA